MKRANNWQPPAPNPFTMSHSLSAVSLPASVCMRGSIGMCDFLSERLAEGLQTTDLHTKCSAHFSSKGFACNTNRQFASIILTSNARTE